jgi:hypothetical protein
VKVIPVPTCWTLATIALVAGLFWFALVFLAYDALPTLPPTSAMLAGVAVASVALGLMTRWSLSLEWHDSSRLAVILGALLASMSSGFPVLLLGGAFAVDMLGKLALNLLACVVLVRLARRIRSRPEEPAALRNRSLGCWHDATDLILSGQARSRASAGRSSAQ